MQGQQHWGLSQDSCRAKSGEPERELLKGIQELSIGNFGGFRYSDKSAPFPSLQFPTPLSIHLALVSPSTITSWLGN